MPSMIVPKEYQGIRLDKALAQLLPQFSRAFLQEALVQGQILVDDKILTGKTKLKGDETICYELIEAPEATGYQPEAVNFDIVYEDNAILVINKPVGLVVHPGAGNAQGTLVNGLLHHDASLAALPRAGVVHRLDKNTSGLMVIAKSREAHHRLVKLLQKHHVQREYVALVYGDITAGGTIDKPIGRDPRDRLKMAVLEEGKKAITHYRLMQRFGDFTLLKVMLETGRTHQIRVHLANSLHPIVGDPVYGRGLRFPKGATQALKEALKNFNHQALHARALAFEHPITSEKMQFEVVLPEDFANLIRLLS